MRKPAYVGRQLCVLLLACFVASASAKTYAQQTAAAPESATPTTPPAQLRSDSQTGTEPSRAESSTSSDMRFGVGDLLEISVYGVPELTTKARVGSSGEIYFPLIDYIHVEGLTPEEAQGVIEKRLSAGGFVNNPHVQIFVSDYASQAVTILGEVTKPGPYPIMGERRLYDVISAAGGLTEKAGRTVTIAHRSTPNQPATVQLAQQLAQTAESNVVIQPGDTIVVQRAGIVYVVGDVHKPSGFILDDSNLTVLKVVALAGGTTRTAKLNSAKILRKTADGVKETPVALKKIMHAKAADIPLQADDILFIPGSAAKAAAYRGTESVLQAATALSIVAARP